MQSRGPNDKKGFGLLYYRIRRGYDTSNHFGIRAAPYIKS